ncbi:hypothetical protein ABZY68_18510 [Streptomyces sp. NPDC006482]|uniref:hypothetical protein n=1 Tax=Streptomyces sp. NPDC006482 TaxID=3154306 RepID=UPI0033AD7AE5
MIFVPALSVDIIPKAFPPATIHLGLFRRPAPPDQSNESLLSGLPASHCHSLGYFLEGNSAASRLAQQSFLRSLCQDFHLRYESQTIENVLATSPCTSHRVCDDGKESSHVDHEMMRLLE